MCNIYLWQVKNNTDVRGLLLKSGIKPESLPAEEDLKKIERKVKSEDKKLLKDTKKLNKKSPTHLVAHLHFFLHTNQRKKMQKSYQANAPRQQ